MYQSALLLIFGSRYYVGLCSICCMAARSGFCRCVGLFTAVKVDLGRPNARSVQANARKGAILLCDLVFDVVDDDDGHRIVRK